MSRFMMNSGAVKQHKKDCTINSWRLWISDQDRHDYFGRYLKEMCLEDGYWKCTCWWMKIIELLLSGFLKTNILIIIVCCVFLPVVSCAEECVANAASYRYDFKLLQVDPFVVQANESSELSRAKLSSWHISDKLADSKILHIFLSLCSPLNITSCGLNSSACIFLSNEWHNIGNYKNKLEVTFENSGLVLELDSSTSCTENETFSSKITFKCGRTLGSPVFVSRRRCVVLVEWQTIAACKSTQPRDLVRPTRCYLYDSNNDKINLDPLVEDNGHEVSNTPTGTRLFISVCRGLGQLPAPSCPASTSACLVKEDGSAVDVGHVTGPLREDGAGSVLRYSSTDGNLTSCPAGWHTTIYFQCPSLSEKANYFSVGRPYLLRAYEAIRDCSFSILWKTDYACPEKESLHKDSCSVDVMHLHARIDLSLLKKQPEEPYSMIVPNGKHGNYTYFLNVCGSVGSSCRQSKASTSGDVVACQKSTSSPSSVKILGVRGKKTLRYADDLLVLTYSGGDACSSGFERRTVIKFYCSDNKSAPRFVQEQYCIYFFEWHTLSACPNQKPSCSVGVKDHFYDLSRLAYGPGNMPAALFPLANSSSFVSINVCGVLQNSECLHNSSICLEDNSTSNATIWISLGTFSHPPQWDEEKKEISITYSGGSKCNANRLFSTKIIFVCPEYHEGEFAPQLTKKPTAGKDCEYEFRWNTFIGCSVTKLQGKDCQLSDNTLGIHYDFNRLQSTFNFSINGVTYSVGICKPLQCNGAVNSGICSKRNGIETSYANFSSIIQLSARTFSLLFPNSSNILLFCSKSAGHSGKLMNESTQHLVQIATSLACFPTFMECKTQLDNGILYDFRSLARDAYDVTNYPAGVLKIKLCGPVGVPKSNCGHDASVCDTKNNSKLKNMGSALEGPKLNKLRLSIDMHNGQLCEDEEGKKVPMESHVDFHCLPQTLGRPRYLAGSGRCRFRFVWPTRVACSPRQLREYCRVFDGKHRRTVDLSPLKHVVRANVFKNLTYQVAVCGVVPGCAGGHGVCQNGRPLAYANYPLEFVNGVVRLRYPPVDNVSVLIDFQCDRMAAEGSPIMHSMPNNLVHFNWRTDLVCPPTAILCRLQNGGDLYDLSPLADANLTGHDGVHLYKIAICQPLPESAGCAAKDAAACQFGEPHGPGVSMGTVKGALRLEEGRLTLRYTGGKRCHVGKPNAAPRSTRVNFVCSNLHEPLAFVEETDRCEYVFVLPTPLACPVKRRAGSNCTLTAQFGRAVYNLNSLRKGGSGFYSVNVGKTKETLLLNICGALPNLTCGAHSAACSNGTNVGNPSTALVQLNGALQLTYSAAASNCTTVVSFFCDREKTGTRGPAEASRSSSECRYDVTWPTMFACSVPYVRATCTVRHPRGYDIWLDELRRHDSNYEVVENGTRYLLQVCGSIVEHKGYDCSVTSGVCKSVVINQKRRFINYGEVPNSDSELFTFLNDSQLILTYNNGAPCMLNESQNYMSKILFRCDRDSKLSAPMLISDGDCLATFHWQTPLVCPPDERHGTNCTVINPHTRYVYDFSSLPPANMSYSVQNTVRRLFISVCSPVKVAGCATDSGSCSSLLDGSDFMDHGKSNGFIWNSPHPHLVYTSGNCNTSIYFFCSLEQTSVHAYLAKGQNNCSVNVLWFTNLACEEMPKCSFSFGPHYFDLTPLLGDEYYRAALMPHIYPTQSSNITILVSVCQHLVSKPKFGCSVKSNICQVFPNKSTVSLGKTQSASYNEEQLSLNYTNGDVCTAQPSINYSSVITFSCAKESDEAAAPTLVDVEAGCRYFFHWKTHAVCSDSPAPKLLNKCKRFINSGIVYELEPLDQVVSVSAGPSTYFINPCGPVAGAVGCGTSAAVCLRPRNAMVRLTRLASHDGRETLEKTPKGFNIQFFAADKCPTQERSNVQVKIVFECFRPKHTDSQHSPIGRPKLVDSRDDCAPAFLWPTALACPPVHEQCLVEASGQDLSLLQRHRSNWRVGGAAELWFNLCSGVQGVPSCPNNAAGCWLRHSSHSSSTRMSVLGLTNTQKLFQMHDHIVAEYSEGDKICPNNTRSKVKVILRCSSSSIGSPVLRTNGLQANNCQFVFEWNTSAVCRSLRTPIDPAVKDGRMLLVDEQNHALLDWADLVQASKVNFITDKIHYQVDLAGINHSTTRCRHAAICIKILQQGPFSIADLNTRKIFFQDGKLQLTYQSNVSCLSDDAQKKYSAVIDVLCDRRNLLKSISLLYVSHKCHYVFEWSTPHGCASFADVVEPVERASNTHTSTIIIVSCLLVLLVVAAVIVYLVSRQRRNFLIGRIETLLQPNSSEVSFQQPSRSCIPCPSKSCLTCFERNEDEDLLLNDSTGISNQNSFPSFMTGSQDDLVL